MKIKRKFIQLTKRTFPYGTESFLERYLPSQYNIDECGNYYLSIGDSTTMFTCHLDTACRDMKIVNHIIDGDIIRTDGKTILGADDKAGMVVLLYMIEKNIPGLYYFFIGEESGCIGSSDLSSLMERQLEYPPELDNITKVISFDRRGTKSIITEQLYGRCCSDGFANELANRLNNAGFGLKMEADPSGIVTDSAQFMGVIQECTNISVGYYNEHKTNECQDISHLYRLCQSVVKIDWETLPVSRTPAKFGWGGWDSESIYDNSKFIRSKEWSKSNFTWIRHPETGATVKVYLSQTLINSETLLILSMLKKQGKNPINIEWDGCSCFAEEHQNNMEYIGSRSNLKDYIPSLGKIPGEHYRYEID